MIYDWTCNGRGRLPGLSRYWGSGALLYRSLGRLDGFRGVASWAEALGWLSEYESSEPIDEIQFWGHGKWGRVLVAGESLDRGALRASHPLHPMLEAVRGLAYFLVKNDRQQEQY